MKSKSKRKPCSRTTRCGSYSLLIRFPATRLVSVGKLGVFEFARGYYVYTGSALSGLEARIAHHLQTKTRPRWHVDFLLAAPGAHVERWIEWETSNRSECELNRRFLQWPGASVPVPGFGSSDCTAGCPAHLVYFRSKPDIERIAAKRTRA